MVLVHLVIAHTHRVLLAKRERQSDVWKVVPRLQRNGRVVGPWVVEYSRQVGWDQAVHEHNTLTPLL